MKTLTDVKIAARKLYDSLEPKEFVTGCGVCADKSNMPAIRIYLLKEGVVDVPTTFEGFNVLPVVTGEIKAL